MPRKPIPPPQIFITKNNAKKMADAFGKLKKRIARLEIEEANFRMAFIKWGQTETLGMIYKVDITFDINVTRFLTKFFCEENPGIAEIPKYNETKPQTMVNVKNIK